MGGKFYLAGGATAAEPHGPRGLQPGDQHLEHGGSAAGGPRPHPGGRGGGQDLLRGRPRGVAGPASAQVYIYDPATNTFTQGAPMPRPRGAGGVAVHQGKIYYAGGLSAGSAGSWFDVYDPATNTWTQLPNMPPGPRPLPRPGRRTESSGSREGANTSHQQHDHLHDRLRLRHGDVADGLRSASDRPGWIRLRGARQRDPRHRRRGRRHDLQYGGGIQHHARTPGEPWPPCPPLGTGSRRPCATDGVYVAAGGTTQGGGGPTDVHRCSS